MSQTSTDPISYRLLRPSCHPATLTCLLVATAVNQGSHGYTGEWYLLVSNDGVNVSFEHELFRIKEPLAHHGESSEEVVREYAVEFGDATFDSWAFENLRSEDTREMFLQKEGFVEVSSSYLVRLMRSNAWRTEILKIAPITHDTKLKHLLEKLGEIKIYSL